MGLLARIFGKEFTGKVLDVIEIREIVRGDGISLKGVNDLNGFAYHKNYLPPVYRVILETPKAGKREVQIMTDHPPAIGSNQNYPTLRRIIYDC